MRETILTMLNALIHRFYGDKVRTYDQVGIAWDRLLGGY